MMNLNLQWSYMEVWSQVVQDWQRDWLRGKARQIVILPTKLTLSSERLRFLGKSQSACCPVSPLHLAWVCGQMTEWGKMGSTQLVRQREWEACDWRLGCLCDRSLSSPTSGSLWLPLITSLCLLCLRHRNSNPVKADWTLFWQTRSPRSHPFFSSRVQKQTNKQTKKTHWTHMTRDASMGK